MTQPNQTKHFKLPGDQLTDVGTNPDIQDGLKQNFTIGDRCSWIAAPDWWNPTGEGIRAIEGEKVLLDYSAIRILTSDLILVQGVAK